MNVLILTPDRVGSTLLQRLLTIYMLRRDFGQPVINLHELTNGLEKYYNPLLNQEVLGKPNTTNWGYYQTLNEVEELLKSVNHYKTSRLARYHIVARKDTIAEQIKFYQYLNENFFVIGCRRENLFEHALSWAINGHSKQLNVFSAEQKVNTFYDIYKNGITVQKETIFNYLDKYKEYINWSDTYFNVQSYFNYDRDVHQIEQYILNLDFMSGSTNNTWVDMFGQEFNDWNACHRLLPNLLLEDRTTPSSHQINLLKEVMDVSRNPEISWENLKGEQWPVSAYDHVFDKTLQLPANIKNEISSKYSNSTQVAVTENEYKFLEKTLPAYKRTSLELNSLVTNRFMVSSVPLKLQSLREKKYIIKNFKDCIQWHNEWVDKNNFGKHYNDEELVNLSVKEEDQLTLPISSQNLLK